MITFTCLLELKESSKMGPWLGKKYINRNGCRNDRDDPIRKDLSTALLSCSRIKIKS